MPTFDPRGVIPACLLPFQPSLEIDEPAYRKHLRDLVAVDGISAITVNGHAAEAHALNPEEQKRGLEIAVDEVGDSIPLVFGVSNTKTQETAQLARMAKESGAAALLLFPNEALALGGSQRQESMRKHIDAVASASDLPIILFQYPESSGLNYPLDDLVSFCVEFPTIVAIKDWCGNPHLHERHIRELHALDRPVNVLTTHSMWLLGSLALGCRGILSGAGSVIADLQVALWNAISSDDLAAAREINDRIFPTVRAFYADPLLDMHNRMKEALVLLGRLEEAHVRPPLAKLDEAEIERVADCLREAGLL